MTELKVYVGAQGDWELQIPNRDGTPATTFQATDTLALSVWEGQQQTRIISKAVDWYQALTAIAVTNGGTFYSSSPVITISGGGATNDATAYAIVTGGAISSIVITDGGTGYTSAPTVGITDGTGSGAAATATITLGWQTGKVAAQLLAAESSLLTPGGIYRFQIAVSRDTLTSVGIDCLLKALATPGTISPTPPDLITYDFANSYCSMLGLTDRQRDNLPNLTAAASMAVRRFCFDRNFDQRSYAEFHNVIQGAVRLFQPPIQVVTRVQGQPQLALTVTNTAAQFAQAYFAYSGTWQGYSTNAQTITGITLLSTTNGVASSSVVTFTANQTISSLATAITAVGSGWTATANSTYGAWPVTELDGGFVGQGCANGAIPSSGAQFNILLDLAPGEFSLDPGRMGLLYVGSQYNGYDAGRWGLGGDSLFSRGSGYGRVKVSYVGGETVIPSEVQRLAADFVKFSLMSANTDWMLASETAQEYSYRLCSTMLASMPKHIAQGLSQYRIPRA